MIIVAQLKSFMTRFLCILKQKTLHLAQVIAVAKIDIKNLTDKCSLSGRVSKMEVAKLFLCCKLSVVSYEFAL